MIHTVWKFIAPLDRLSGQLAAIELPAGDTEISNPTTLNASVATPHGRAEKIASADGSPGFWRLTVTGSDGRPLAGQQVRLTLRRHEFGFGSAAPVSYCGATTADAKRFRETIDRLFSMVVFENDLKDMWWEKTIPPHERATRQQESAAAFSDPKSGRSGRYWASRAMRPTEARRIGPLTRLRWPLESGNREIGQISLPNASGRVVSPRSTRPAPRDTPPHFTHPTPPIHSHGQANRIQGIFPHHRCGDRAT